MPEEFPDALASGHARGRGAGLNPGNRFETARLAILGDTLDEALRDRPDGVHLRTTVLRDRTRSIINHVDSPDISYKWSINPYRGCEHGCIYCYARPTHEELGMSCGLDFETKIMAKQDAPALLRRELASPRWTGEPIMFSGVTDCYQPLEAKLRITRGCLEVMAECRQPVGLITKNRLITRDLDLLCELARHNAVRAAVSITTLDAKLAGAMEPRASRPADRLRAVRELASAGVPVSVMVAPVIPGLTDHEMPRILQAAADAGASSAGWVLLRLPYQIKALFLEWLARIVPERAARIENAMRGMRGGALYESDWRIRQRGRGCGAEQIARTFEVFSKRFGLVDRGLPISSAAFRRARLDGQLGLFDDFA